MSISRYYVQFVIKRGIALERLAGAGFFTNWFNCGEESTAPVLE